MDTIDLAPLPIGQRLRLLRVYAGDSVLAVATRWGKDKSYVYRVERDEATPSPLEVRDVVEAAERFSEQLAEPTGDDAPGLRPRALPVSANLDEAKAHHEYEPPPPPDKPIRRPRGTQSGA